MSIDGLTHVTADGAPAPDGSFSHAVVDGSLIYVSGQGPFAADTGEVVGDNIETQTRQVFENLRAILAAAGADFGDVLKVDVHLADFELFERYDQVYRTLFPPPRPARKTVASGLGGILVEADCVARRAARG